MTSSLPPWERPQWQQPDPGGTPAVEEADRGQVAHGDSAYAQPGYHQPGYHQPGHGQQLHGQQLSGQPTYAQPGYDQYGQQLYGQQPYGQQPYGQGPWTQPPYGQPAWGQQYGSPQYGSHPYGAPAGPPRRISRTVLGWSIAGVLVLAALIIGAVLAADAATPETTVAVPAPTWLPTGLGDEPALDELAEQCHAGAMTACDDLYFEAEIDSEYEEYGDTCAGRRSGGAWAMCADVFTDAD